MELHNPKHLKPHGSSHGLSHDGSFRGIGCFPWDYSLSIPWDSIVPMGSTMGFPMGCPMGWIASHEETDETARGEPSAPWVVPFLVPSVFSWVVICPIGHPAGRPMGSMSVNGTAHGTTYRTSKAQLKPPCVASWVVPRIVQWGGLYATG